MIIIVIAIINIIVVIIIIVLGFISHHFVAKLLTAGHLLRLPVSSKTKGMTLHVLWYIVS